MRHLIILLLVMGGTYTDIYPQVYTEKAEEIYHHILNVRWEEAEEELRNWNGHPAAQAHLYNYLMFLQLYIHEEADRYDDLYPYKQQHLQQVRDHTDVSSPYYLFLQADILLQWAIIEAKFRDFYTSFRDVRNAHALLEENEKLFPDFLPNKKDRGVLVALVGTIPENYRWGLEWLSGIPGDLKQGMESLKMAAASDEHMFSDEAKMIYGHLLIHVLKEEKEGWKWLSKVSISPRESPLATILLANAALDVQKLDTAVDLLNHWKDDKRVGIPQIHYFNGLAALYSGKYEASIKHFNEFLSHFNGMHGIKSALLHKAYAHYILGQTSAAEFSLAQCRQRGDVLMDDDKVAFQFAKKGVFPPVDLLQLQLFYDGGNFEKALHHIRTNRNTFTDLLHRKILKYYEARVFEALGKWQAAAKAYQAVIAMPEKEQGHYAANSALHLGYILEELEDCRQASVYFRMCLEIESEDYNASIDHRAKAALMKCQE